MLSPSAATGVKLADLLERVEKATGPNFELERSLFEALAMPTEWFGSAVISHFRMGAGYGLNTEDGFRHLDCLATPAYTASLDAALALVERLCPPPRWWWRVERSPRPYASIWLDPGPMGRGYGATPALAVIEALLKALIAQTET